MIPLGLVYDKHKAQSPVRAVSSTPEILTSQVLGFLIPEIIQGKDS